MTTPEQQLRGQGSRINDAHDNPVIENLTSLLNIIDDISSKINHQVLGNCDTLLHLEAKLPRSSTTVEDDNNGEQLPLKVFQSNQIEILIKSPLKLSLGRLKGLRKVISHIQDQVSSRG